MKDRNSSANSVTQRTLKESISYVGRGLHTGRRVSMVVRPGEPNTGVYFLRKDAPPGHGLVPARWYNLMDAELSTAIANEHGVIVRTIEHLLAALRACGIDNAMVELDGPEVPIMDGSAQPFVALFEHVGTVDQREPRYAIWIHRPIEVRYGDRLAMLVPATTSRITVEIDFPNSAVGFQMLSIELDDAFRRDIAGARTFGFASEIEYLRRRGLARGGSLRNAVVVDGYQVVNEEGLRYKDEFVRHKVLDCFGDLALLGVPVLGHFYAYKPGHEINHALLRQLSVDKSRWSYLTIDEFDAMMRRKGESLAELTKGSDETQTAAAEH